MDTGSIWRDELIVDTECAVVVGGSFATIAISMAIIAFVICIQVETLFYTFCADGCLVLLSTALAATGTSIPTIQFEASDTKGLI